MVCVNCGVDTFEGWRYCPVCGAELCAAAHEQSVVTALFVDLVASTRLARAMNADEYFEFMRGLLNHLSAEVVSCGGRVIQFQGDAVLAVFGIHEDPKVGALRAARAAIACLDGIRALGAQYSTPLRGRAGLDTDTASLGLMGGEFTVMGNVVNLARRLCSAARVGEALVSEATRGWVADHVQFEATPHLEIRDYHDVSGPYRLLRLAEKPAAGALAPFIGREAELGAINELMRDTLLARTPSRVAVIGLAGSGKTRLVAQAAEGFPNAQLIVVRPGLGLGGLARALLPSRAWEDLAGLAGALEDLGLTASGVGLSSVLGLSGENADPTVPLAKLLQAVANKRPVFLALDRWDELEPGLRAMLEAFDGWRSGACLTIYLGSVIPDGVPTIELAPLNHEDSQSLVASLAGQAAVQTFPNLLADADGIPLFLIQAARIIATPKGRGAPRPLSALIAQVLSALTPEARRVLAAATLIGPEFDLGSLSLLVGDDAEPGLELASRRGWVVPVEGFRRARQHVGTCSFTFATPVVEEAAALFTRELRGLEQPDSLANGDRTGDGSRRQLLFNVTVAAREPKLN